MDTAQAINILIGAVQTANTKGAFTLQESKIIYDAVNVLTTPLSQPKGTEQPKEPENVASTE